MNLTKLETILPRMKASEMKLYMALIILVKRLGRTLTTTKEVEEKAGLSERSVREAFEGLAELGVITFRRERGGYYYFSLVDESVAIW